MPAHLSVKLASARHVEASGTGQPVDTIPVSAGDEVLLMGQNVSAYNGVFVVGAGNWQRRADFATAAQMEAGTTFYVREGAEHRRSEFFLEGSVSLVNSSHIGFGRRSYAAALVAGSGLEYDPVNNDLSLRQQHGVQGTYTNPVVTLDAHGVAEDAFSGGFDPAHAEGLAVDWETGTAVVVGEGSVWIEGTTDGEMLVVEAPIRKTGLVLPGNSWVYAYVWSNSGTPDLEFSTTAPAAPYHGAARSKAGDPSRRYVPMGALRTDASGNIRRFFDVGNFRRWLLDVATLRILNGGSATANTAVSAAAWMPPTSRMGFFRMGGLYVSAGGTAFLGAAGAADPLSPQAGEGQLSVTVGQNVQRNTAAGPVVTDAGQAVRYAVDNASMSANIDMLGYWEER